MKKEFKLYNVFFPIWFLYFYPAVWLITLPVNYLIDRLVTTLSLKHLKVENRKEIVKKTILKTWIFGFVADIIGGILMILPNVLQLDYNSKLYHWWEENITSGIMLNPFKSPYSFLYVLGCVLVSSWFIYFFNKNFVFKKIDIDEEIKHKVSLYLAIFTAPIFFLLPSANIIGFY